MPRHLLLSLLFLLLPALAHAEYKAELTQDQAQARIEAKQITVIDVRTPAEYSAGHVPGAINIPYDVIGKRLADIPTAKDKPVLLYCHSGRRAAKAEAALTQAGYSQLYHLKGDMMGWVENKRPIAK